MESAGAYAWFLHSASALGNKAWQFFTGSLLINNSVQQNYSLVSATQMDIISNHFLHQGRCGHRQGHAWISIATGALALVGLTGSRHGLQSSNALFYWRMRGKQPVQSTREGINDKHVSMRGISLG